MISLINTTATSLTFFLPIPEAALSPNWRGHWSRKSAATRIARTAARVEALRVVDGGERPKWERAKWKAVWYLVSGRKQPDPDNSVAWLKAYIDGICDAGIVANDRNLWPERPEFHAVPRMPRVEITITPEV